VTELTDAERAVLQLADSGLQLGAMANAIRDLGFSSDTAYAAALNELIGTEKAEREFPVLVHRLRRLRRSSVAFRRRFDYEQGAS
jgi:hypothetical protein